jgi:hypothetical protein
MSQVGKSQFLKFTQQAAPIGVGLCVSLVILARSTVLFSHTRLTQMLVLTHIHTHTHTHTLIHTHSLLTRFLTLTHMHTFACTHTPSHQVYTSGKGSSAAGLSQFLIDQATPPTAHPHIVPHPASPPPPSRPGGCVSICTSMRVRVCVWVCVCVAGLTASVIRDPGSQEFHLEVNSFERRKNVSLRAGVGVGEGSRSPYTPYARPPRRPDEAKAWAVVRRL